jgi:hypothetical protein
MARDHRRAHRTVGGKYLLRPQFSQHVAGPRLQITPIQTHVLLDFGEELECFGAQPMHRVRAVGG